MKSQSLLSLIAQLKGCPAHDPGLSRERFLSSWNNLLHEEVEHLVKPTLPIMAALLLNDERFAPLLSEPEQAQLLALVSLAIDRYEQRTNPPNQLGKLIAGSIKKESL